MYVRLKNIYRLHIYPLLENGGWGVWSGWKSCTVTCGNGIQSRSRSCNNPAPLYGGRQCVGSSGDSKTCNNKNCPGICFFKYISHTFAFLMKYTYTIFLSNRTNCLNPSSEFITQTMSNCNWKQDILLFHNLLSRFMCSCFMNKLYMTPLLPTYSLFL